MIHKAFGITWYFYDSVLEEKSFKCKMMQAVLPELGLEPRAPALCLRQSKNPPT